MYLAQIWRYPVKSMNGEAPQRLSLGSMALKVIALCKSVIVAAESFTSRTRPRLLGHHATLAGDGHISSRARSYT